MKTVTMKEWVDPEYNALTSNAKLFLGKKILVCVYWASKKMSRVLVCCRNKAGNYNHFAKHGLCYFTFIWVKRNNC